MALSKTNTVIDDWATIAAASVRTGATHDMSNGYSATLHILFATTEAIAHNDCTITVETRSGPEDEDWVTLTEFRTATVTADVTTVDVESPAAGKKLYVANTTNLETVGLLLLVFDDTVPDSEVVRGVGAANDGDDYIATLDNLVNTHAITTTSVSNNVQEFSLELPMGASTVRVLINNLDADCDATSHTSIDKTTGL